MPLMPEAPQPYADADATADERNYAVYQHLTVLGAAVPFLGLVLSILLWHSRRDHSPFLDDHGRESVNFQISLLIYAAVAGVLSLSVRGVFAFWPLAVLALVGMFLGARAASRGQFFRYPMCVRLLS